MSRLSHEDLLAAAMLSRLTPNVAQIALAKEKRILDKCA